MKAIAVRPGTANSMHLQEVPEPSVSDIPDGRGVLVTVLRVGVDGTDKEINAADYGDAPEGDDYLITGHERLRPGRGGRSRRPRARSAPERCVVATVRRPGNSHLRPHRRCRT